MSTYITRVIEVKLPDIDGVLYKIQDLDGIKDLRDNMVFEITTEREYPYMIWHADTGQWEKSKECKWSWHLVKYWSDYKYGYHDTSKPADLYLKAGETLKAVKEITDFCDNGGSIRDKYLSTWYDYNIKGRGLAPDMDEETKKVMHVDEKDYGCYGYTYVLLSELETIYEKDMESFKNDIKEYFNKEEHKTINKKLDKIYNKLTGEPIPENTDEQIDEEDIQTFDYLFDEVFWEIQTLNAEIIKIYHTVDQIYGFIPEDRIRINYYFS